MKSVIIGAGPVGSYAASLLAKKQEVSLFEEHASIGAPVHCTGIVTPEIFNFIPKKSKFVINKIHDIRIFAPDSSFLRLSFRQPDLVLNRVAFDQHFFSLACKAGALSNMKHRFLSIIKDSAVIKDLSSGKRKIVKFNRLIGADGPNSAVGRSAGLLNHRKFFIGVQAIVKKRNNNILDFYPFQDGFGWSVPVDSNTLRIGVASQKNPKDAFEHLLKRYGGRSVDKHGGLIPIYNPKAKFCAGGISLAGDAAGFVKATTGGGLVPGLRSAEILAQSKDSNLRYASGVSFNIAPSLWLNLQARRTMDSFKLEDWNRLINDLQNESARQALQNVNRDALFGLLLRLFAAKPGLVKYGLKRL